MVDIELYEIKFANSEPITYNVKKGGEITISPMLLKDYDKYSNISYVLSIDKNDFHNEDFISMSNLEFLYTLVNMKDEFSLIINNALVCFGNCLGYDEVAFTFDSNRICLTLCKNGIIEKVIKPKEFNDIKKIFLYQNNPNYDDREISQDMKQIMNDYYKLKYKDINVPTLEQKKAFVSSKIGKTFRELGELPIREFDMVYQSCVDSEIYIAQKIIQGSYKYDVKEDIPFPLYEKKKDPYQEALNGKNDLSQLNGIENIGEGLE